jgi:tRNA_anti-like
MRKSVYCLVFLIGLPVISVAQWKGPMGYQYNNPFSSLAATMAMNKAREQDLARRLGVNNPNNVSAGRSNAASAQQQMPTPVAKPIDDRQLRYKPDPAASKLRSLADGLGNSQAERDQYLQIMQAVVALFDQKTEQAGYPHDLALALSYFIGENLRIYHGQPEAPDAQFVDLRNTIAQSLSDGAAFKNATDAQKQEVYETLVAYTGVTQFGYESSLKAGQQEMANGYRKLAGQNILTLTKISPETVSFGPGGLIFTGTAEPMSQPSTKPTVPSAATIEIRQLALEFKENELRANQLYKGKRMVVVGKVGSIEKYLGVTVLVFDRGLLNPDTICYFPDLNQLAQLRRNQGVTVAATVRGFENNENITLVLENCSLQ